MSENNVLIHPKYVRSEELGNEITELFGYITAATYELLVKIREFDEKGLWQLGGSSPSMFILFACKARTDL